MNENNPCAREEQSVICHCSGTTDAQIRTLIAEGFNDLESLSRQTGAVAGCGACESDILDLLVENRSGQSAAGIG